MSEQPWNVYFPPLRKGDPVGVVVQDGTVRVELYGEPPVDAIKRMQESLRRTQEIVKRLTKPSLWQQIRRWYR